MILFLLNHVGCGMQKRLFTVFFLLFLISACKKSSENDAPKVEQDAIVEEEYIAVSDNVKKWTDANQLFTTDLYRQQLGKHRGENIVISPLSVATAFAALYAGSAKQTQEEFSNTFYFDKPEDAFHHAVKSLNTALSKGSSEPDFVFKSVNMLWGEQSYDYSSTYINKIHRFYNADIKVGDMINQHELMRKTINAWVEEQTESLIKNLLPPGSVTPNSKLILTNAVYLNAKWLHPFSPNNTYDRDFKLLSKQSLSVPIMEKHANFKVYKNNQTMLVELPYKNENWAMYLLTVPVEEFEQLERHLDPTRFNTMLAKLTTKDAVVFVPKFSFGTNINLTPSLQALGLNSAFNAERADFSLINERRKPELSIDSAIHKAFINVDEAGTEAAAATGISVGVTSVPEWYVFDRPFMFFIRHKPTNTNVFMGRVINPLK